MKKIIILITIMITMAILLFVVYTKAEYSKLTEDEALEIGEEKYLKFLWMVDGAFNSDRLDGEFIVNGKILNDDDKIFTCTRENKNDNNCVGNNFEKEFKNLFASNISYNMVYSDDTFYTWIKYVNDKYVFSILNSCNISRMDLNQTLRLISIENDRLVFHVISQDDGHKKEKIRAFTLIKENNDWKVSKAYYHDICDIDYNIG